MSIYCPIFFSLQVGNSGVYSWFLESEKSDYLVDEYLISSVIMYLKSTPSIIGLSLYGNELTNPCIRLLLDVCRSKDVKVSVDISCNETDIDFYYKYSDYINLVRVLCASMDAKTHNEMFCDNNLDRVKAFIRTNSTGRTGKVVVIPVLKQNVDDLRSVCEFAVAHNFKINPLPIPTECVRRAHSLDQEQFEKMLVDLAELQLIYGDDLYLDVPTGFKCFAKPSICPGFRLAFDVTVSGKVRPCKFSDIILHEFCDIQKRWDSISDVWRFSSVCNACEDYGKCGGGCLGNKRSISSPDYYCNKFTEKMDS